MLRKAGSHLPGVILLALLAILWTWPLAIHFREAIPGSPGDNYSFLWNLWWMRKALSAQELGFFSSPFLFSPFGVDLVNHPNTALQGWISATVLANLSVIEAENAYIVLSVFLNALSGYALAFDITRERRVAVLAAVAFGGSPYIAAHLLGHFDLLTAWVLPLFALLFRRALLHGGVVTGAAAGLCAAVAAYTAYYYVVYLGMFALAYLIGWWDCVRLRRERRADPAAGFTLRLLIVGLIVTDLFLILWILLTGGTSVNLGGFDISVRTPQNPMLGLYVLVAAWLLTRWRIRIRVARPQDEVFWKGMQAVTTGSAVFAVACLPLILEGFRLAVSGRYVSQIYYWRSAPRGVDALAPLMGNPFHPLLGQASSGLYSLLGMNRIDAVGWIGIVPILVLLAGRGQWLDAAEARRWKIVLAVFAVFALGPFLTVAGFDLGLPLPQLLARFIPVVENARMPGRAMVGVYLSLGMLMALRLSLLKPRPAVMWLLIALISVDYLNAPVPLTALDRPAVYEQLAAIDDGGGVIEVPFGIGDGLSAGIGEQDRRVLYYATIHGHPLVGGYIGRMPPGVARAYQAMPVVGNLLRLSAGEPAFDEPHVAAALPFRYLVLDLRTASPALIDYVHANLDMDLVAMGDGRELYAVQGVKPPSVRVSR